MKKNSLLIIDLNGLSMVDCEVGLLARPVVAGVILFSRNYQDRQQLKALITQIRDVRKDLAICVDQEGGRVQRLREGFTRLPPLRYFGQLYAENSTGALKAAKESAYTMASELLEVGIDFSFAPVLDVDYGTSEVIGDRSFSSDPAVIVELAKAYVSGLKHAGMPAVAKHYPGHGFVTADSHHEMPIDNRMLDEIKKIDLKPFAELANELEGIMPAHVIYEKIDDKPAGFSKVWLQDILRKQLNFKGIIYSDDLTMEAAKTAGSVESRIDLALEAGCDRLLVCNDAEAAKRAIAHVEEKAQ